jgi:hypothetical protein
MAPGEIELLAYIPDLFPELVRMVCLFAFIEQQREFQFKDFSL